MNLDTKGWAADTSIVKTVRPLLFRMLKVLHELLQSRKVALGDSTLAPWRACRVEHLG